MKNLLTILAAAVLVILAAPASPCQADSRGGLVAFDSSFIAGAEYFTDTQVLYVHFKDGKIYAYKAVPEDVFKALCDAPSKGRFFHTSIRGKFEFELIDAGIMGDI